MWSKTKAYILNWKFIEEIWIDVIVALTSYTNKPYFLREISRL